MASVAIRLERWTSTKDAKGDFKETVQKFNLFADVTRLSGSKSSLNGQTNLSAGMEFKIRFRPDFKPSGNWKVVYDGLRYDVTSIEKEDEKRFYWIFKTDGKGVQR